VAALQKEAAKWQEMEESKMFLETQVAQFRSAKQQEATRAENLAAQVPSTPCDMHSSKLWKHDDACSLRWQVDSEHGAVTVCCFC